MVEAVDELIKEQSIAYIISPDRLLIPSRALHSPSLSSSMQSTTQEGLNCSTAHGEDDGRPRPSGATAHSAFLPARFFPACGFDSSPRPSLFLVYGLYACVCLRGRAFSFSFVSISFGLSALFVFNCSILLVFSLPVPSSLARSPSSSSLSSPHTSSLAV